MRWLIAVLFIASVAAHVPTFNEAGSSPETAFVVDDPTKSWVFYETMEGPQHWFRFDMEAGTVLFTSVQLPPQEAARPTLWVVGPGFEGAGPTGTPSGLGAQMAMSEDSLSVEPFSPLAMRSVAEWRDEVPASGTYYVVIESDRPTTYSVAIGSRESFTVGEWAGVPVERVAIQTWGGVPWILAITGELIGITAAVTWAVRRSMGARGIIGSAGAGAVAGTAVSTIVLAVIAASRAGWSAAVIIPFVFAAVAALIGFAAWRTITKDGSVWVGLGLAAAAIVAWAGILVGPVALIAWSFWPRAKAQDG